MKLEETENLKLQFVNNIQTTTSQINNINESDTELSKKLLTFRTSTRKTQVLMKNQNHLSKKWGNYCRPYIALLNEDKNNKITKINHNKNIHSNNSSDKLLPNNSNYSRQQSPYNAIYSGRSPYQRNSRSFSQNRYSRSHSRNNYSRSNSNQPEFSFNTSSHSNSRNSNHSNNRSRNSSFNRYRNFSNDMNRIYLNNRNPRYQNNRSCDYSNNRSKYSSYQNRSRDHSQNRNSS